MKGAFYCTQVYLPMLLLSITQAVPVSRSNHSTQSDVQFSTITPATEATILKKECYYEGKEFRDGQIRPSVDVCELCTCIPPSFTCTIRVCDVKPGCKAIHTAGKCCPEYLCDCYKNGRTYGNGEKVEEPNPCNVCYCRGGEIQCTGVTCYTRTDCEPHYVAGKCCPKYDHCPPIVYDSRPSTIESDSASTATTANDLKSLTTAASPPVNEKPLHLLPSTSASETPPSSTEGSSDYKISTLSYSEFSVSPVTHLDNISRIEISTELSKVDMPHVGTLEIIEVYPEQKIKAHHTASPTMDTKNSSLNVPDKHSCVTPPTNEGLTNEPTPLPLMPPVKNISSTFEASKNLTMISRETTTAAKDAVEFDYTTQTPSSKIVAVTATPLHFLKNENVSLVKKESKLEITNNAPLVDAAKKNSANQVNLTTLLSNKTESKEFATKPVTIELATLLLPQINKPDFITTDGQYVGSTTNPTVMSAIPVATATETADLLRKPVTESTASHFVKTIENAIKNETMVNNNDNRRHIELNKLESDDSSKPMKTTENEFTSISYTTPSLRVGNEKPTVIFNATSITSPTKSYSVLEDMRVTLPSTERLFTVRDNTMSDSRRTKLSNEKNDKTGIDNVLERSSQSASTTESGAEYVKDSTMHTIIHNADELDKRSEITPKISLPPPEKATMLPIVKGDYYVSLSTTPMTDKTFTTTPLVQSIISPQLAVTEFSRLVVPTQHSLKSLSSSPASEISTMDASTEAPLGVLINSSGSTTFGGIFEDRTNVDDVYSTEYDNSNTNMPKDYNHYRDSESNATQSKGNKNENTEKISSHTEFIPETTSRTISPAYDLSTKMIISVAFATTEKTNVMIQQKLLDHDKKTASDHFEINNASLPTKHDTSTAPNIKKMETNLENPIFYESPKLVTKTVPLTTGNFVQSTPLLDNAFITVKEPSTTEISDTLKKAPEILKNNATTTKPFVSVHSSIISVSDTNDTSDLVSNKQNHHNAAENKTAPDETNKKFISNHSETHIIDKWFDIANNASLTAMNYSKDPAGTLISHNNTSNQSEFTSHVANTASSIKQHSSVSIHDKELKNDTKTYMANNDRPNIAKEIMTMSRNTVQTDFRYTNSPLSEINVTDAYEDTEATIDLEVINVTSKYDISDVSNYTVSDGAREYTEVNFNQYPKAQTPEKIVQKNVTPIFGVKKANDKDPDATQSMKPVTNVSTFKSTLEEMTTLKSPTSERTTLAFSGSNGYSHTLGITTETTIQTTASQAVKKVTTMNTSEITKEKNSIRNSSSNLKSTTESIALTTDKIREISATPLKLNTSVALENSTPSATIPSFKMVDVAVKRLVNNPNITSNQSHTEQSPSSPPIVQTVNVTNADKTSMMNKSSTEIASSNASLTSNGNRATSADEQLMRKQENTAASLAEILLKWLQGKRTKADAKKNQTESARKLESEKLPFQTTKKTPDEGNETPVSLLSALSGELMKIAHEIPENASLNVTTRDNASRSLELNPEKVDQSLEVRKEDIEFLAEALTNDGRMEPVSGSSQDEPIHLKYPYTDESLAPVLSMISDQLQFLKVGEEQPLYIQQPEEESTGRKHEGVVVVPKTAPVTVDMIKVYNGNKKDRRASNRAPSLL